MRCEDAKNLFSHYLEDDLEVKTKKLLDEHLAGCSVCAKELAQLREIVSGLKKIPEVEPPPYFLEAVHARLEKKAALLERILKRLFVPFYIKVPLEAVALTATVIIIFVLVQRGEIARLTLTQETLQVSRQNAEKLIQPDLESKEFEKMHPQEMASQMASADFQKMSQAQSMAPALKSSSKFDKVSEGNLLPGMQEEKAISYKNALTPEAYKSRTVGTYADIKADYLEESAGIKKERLLSKVMMDKEIILKAKELGQDRPKLESILHDLGIINIKTEIYPERILFSFSILANQLELLLSRLKDWQVLSAPAKEIAGKEEALLEPISVKLTLTTQETP